MERFYLLCPTTGYAGEYIWSRDAMSGTLEILKHNNIPAEEWQMGTTKVFIRHPETVSYTNYIFFKWLLTDIYNRFLR